MFHRRKKVWAAKQAKPDTEIEHQLIQDAEDSKFFHCTVEVSEHPLCSVWVLIYRSLSMLSIAHLIYM